MSFEAMGWAWKQNLPASTKMVLLVLADHHNETTGKCNPKVKSIAERAGLSERNTSLQIKKLAEEGFLEIQHNHREDGSLTSSTYILALGTDREAPGVLTEKHQGGVTVAEQEPGNLESSNDSESGKPSAHQQVMDWYQETLGYKIPNGGQEGKAVKWLLNEGYSLEDIQKCYTHLKSQHFWEGKHLSLQVVKREIGAWKQWKGKSNGHSDPRKYTWENVMGVKE